MADSESVSWIFLHNSAKKLTLLQPLSNNNSAITYLINPVMLEFNNTPTKNIKTQQPSHNVKYKPAVIMPQQRT